MDTLVVVRGLMSLIALLAFAADLYIPLLALFYLKRLLRADRTSRYALLCLLLVNLGIAWGLMYADQAGAIWSAWQLDYSTHAAVSLAFLIGLGISAPRQTPVCLLSLVIYAALMRELGYHSLADVVTTVVAAGTLMGMAGLGITRSRRSAPVPCKRNERR